MTEYFFDSSGGYYCGCGEYVQGGTTHACKLRTITVCSWCKKVWEVGHKCELPEFKYVLYDDLHEHEMDGENTGKVKFIEPDYKRAYYVLSRLVAQAYENTEENSEAVEDYVKRAMEFIESNDPAQKV